MQLREFSFCSSDLNFLTTCLHFAVGETTNLMSVDTQKFMDLALYINMLWCSPFQILLCMYFLWGILGPASMAGMSGLHRM